ncbi:MAG: 4-hydroxy-tetrahydrodipicolinate reductase [Planctomycetota bacterium]
MSEKLSLAMHGAAGRMGRRVVAMIQEDPDCELVSAIEHADCPHLGTDAGTLAGLSPAGVELSSSWPSHASALIDFSLPSAVEGVIASAAQAGIPLVMATTGLEEAQKAMLVEASKSLPIVFAPSMSPAVNVTMKLAQQVASSLGSVPGGLDIEIIERHHRYKADAPSGTALRFGELIAEKMDGEVKHLHGREGETGARTQAEIGYHAVRVGDNPGEHTIVFGMLGERIELNVAASNRDCYATGAIVAAKWLTGKPAGLYNMFDVLEL